MDHGLESDVECCIRYSQLNVLVGTCHKNKYR